MASHADILTSAAYATLLQTINDRLSDLARAADPANSSVTNYAVGGVRWSSAAGRWQKNTGTQAAPVWSDLATAYAISISGNAATADTLQTARTINGVSFNGSAAITITANTTQALTISSGGDGATTGATFNGSAARTISYNSIGAPSTSGAGASGTWGIGISGNAATVTAANDTTTSTAQYVYFGSTSAGAASIKASSTKLTFVPSTGVLTAVGNVATSSDRRLKSGFLPLTGAMERVRAITGYTYKKKGTKGRQVGVIAQDVQSVLPEAVHMGDDGYLSVAYGNLAALLIEAIKELDQRIRALESR